MKKIKGIEWRTLWTAEDWLAVWFGLCIILIASISVISGKFDFEAAKFGVWESPGELAAQFDRKLWLSLLRTFFVLAILFVFGNVMRKMPARKYAAAFACIFGLSVLVRLVSAQFLCNRYLEWAFFAFLIGLLISNVFGVPGFMRAAMQAEFYVKTGLVIMGFSVLFSNIINFGFYGLGIAWLVTPVVMIFMWYFGIHVLKMENRPFVITIAAATAVCGTSAAIAAGAASKARKSDISLAISISILFTILMMVLEPIVIRASGMGELMGGALIGGTIDSTGAVTVAGTVLGELAQTTAVLIKSIQNVLIGVIAFAVALFFSDAESKRHTAESKVKAVEIWVRIPKFIIGFLAASLAASFVFMPVVGRDLVNEINRVLDQYKNWLFVMAFTCIGLETNFREIREQIQGGKPFILYLAGQLFNILLTFLAVYILLSGRFLALPDIAI